MVAGAAAEAAGGAGAGGAVAAGGWVCAQPASKPDNNRAAVFPFITLFHSQKRFSSEPVILTVELIYFKAT